MCRTWDPSSCGSETLAGKPLAELVAPLPDEFHSWVHDVANGITVLVDSETARLTEAYTKVVGLMPTGWDPKDRAGRKDFAAVAARDADGWAFFALLDGKDVGPELLRRARPEPFLTLSGHTFSEETA